MKPQKYPIFNNKYEILQSLGSGSTSKVYLVRLISNPTQYFALKLLK
jgi:serine/threonine protein kinase